MNLDLKLYVALLVPHILLVVLLPVARILPYLQAPGKWSLRGVWERLTHDDEESEAISLERIVGYLAYVVLVVLLAWWKKPAVAGADVDTDGLLLFICFLCNVIIVAWVLFATVFEWDDNPPMHSLDGFVNGLLNDLFSLNLVVLILIPWAAIYTKDLVVDGLTFQNKLAYTRVNHYQSVAHDWREIARVKESDITATLCVRAMRQAGDSFLKAAATQPELAVRYARCVLLTKGHIPK